MNDRIEQIEARADAATEGPWEFDDAREDVPYLIALVREQQAQIGRARELHESSFSDQWGRTSEVPTEFGGWCKACGNFRGRSCPTIAALTATEGA